MKRTFLLLILFVISLLQSFGQTLTQADTFVVHRITGTFYADKFVGRKTASGEVFRQDRYTAAHKSLKFGTLVLVTNPDNGRQVIVRINDRCPRPGIIDLTRRGAKQIGISSRKVDIQILPERFHHYWEHQEDYLDILEAGTFLTHAEQPYMPSILDNPTPTPTPHPTSPQPSKSHHQTKSPAPQHQPVPPSTPPAHTPPAPPKEPLFDLEICTISPNNDPRIVIEKLPIHYRNKVEIIDKDDIRIINLRLESPKQEAQQVQSDLYQTFPRSRLHPSHP